MHILSYLSIVDLVEKRTVKEPIEKPKGSHRWHGEPISPELEPLALNQDLQLCALGDISGAANQLNRLHLQL
jgi:hypothetical protein